MKQKKSTQYDEVGYWESFSDVLVGLLLCVLLIALLLILYLVRIPDEELIDQNIGDKVDTNFDPYHGGGNWGYEDPDDGYEGRSDYDSNGGHGGYGGYGGYGGGGGDEDEDEHHEDEQFEDPDPGAGEGTGIDRAAVYVQVVDGGTGRTIKQKGMAFELYTPDDALQTLSVYYPERIDYTKFETTTDGVFFLPEKLPLAEYYLHDLTAVNGYDTVDKTNFTLEEASDWNDPTVVTVELYPSRNTVRIQLRDGDSGRKIGGGVFSIIAQKDIVTKDGTTRFTAGQIVDTVTLDANGYGESIPLYLGEYRIRQTQSPEYYAALLEESHVSVVKSRNGVQLALTELTQQKTTIHVELVDELYPGKGIADAEFLVTTGNGLDPRRVRTDENGRIQLTNLKASTTYHIKQLTTAENYEIDTNTCDVVVDSQGYIDNQVAAKVIVKNPIVRVSIGVQGMISPGLVSDVNVALYNAEGELLKIWNSSALEQVFEGMAPGEYYLIFGGQEASKTTMIVEKTAKMQSFYYRQWTTGDIGVVIVMALVAVGLLTGIVILGVKMRQNRKEK